MNTRTSNVSAKSVYERAEPGDGRRVLVTRYWPRGVPKTAADEYIPELGPSVPLLRAYKDGEITWDTYRTRYLAEMRREEARAEIHRLAKTARSEKITVMCMCKLEDQCHRSLLRDLIAGFDEEPDA